MSDPAVSVVLSVSDDLSLLTWAIESLRRQTLGDWELLPVGAGAVGATREFLDCAATADQRIRLVEHPFLRGRAAAYSAARGYLIAYLDSGGEFYHDHLARAWEGRGRGDVLVFRYDLIADVAGSPDAGTATRYDPLTRHDKLFSESVVAAIGVVHRRELLARIEPFTDGPDYRSAVEADDDLWRKLARVGARFVYIPAASGKWRVRSDTQLSLRPAASPCAVPPALVAVTVHNAVEKRQMLIPRDETGTVARIFGEGKYDGVPVDKLRVPPVIVDVGANVGVFALYAKLRFHRDAIVHCFEPHLPTIELLRRNVRELPGVTVHPFGLGRGDVTAELRLDPRSSAGHSIKAEHVRHPEGIARVTLRDAGAVWDDLGLGEVDVLKLDACGCEGDILEALGPHLTQVRFVLVALNCVTDRPRIEALLPRHQLVIETTRTAEPGLLKFVRLDLRGEMAARVTVHSTHIAGVGPADRTPVMSGFAATSRARGSSYFPRVMFASYHCYHDSASGAALCTRDLFALLTARGWACRVFTGPNLDDPVAPPVGDKLRAYPTTQMARGRFGNADFTLYHSQAGGFPVTMFAPDPPAATRSPTQEEARAFAAVLSDAIREFRPDVVLTYGGDDASRAVVEAGRAVGAAVVFWLHNRAYTDATIFRDCDTVVVPSEASRGHYRDLLGLESVVLPGPWM
ncbi:FkbM family methyltransferase [Fimbriiglobus ruber]|uniref:Putative O-linked N-acetylglucosamine transferase, SPINDLY family n=1 Tax=Fimbriiglobus ruber TaxID=1908690 RepID=A0A225DG13_9BACT|nr:FkbM family methyltransferase [Fimbriiglobus ruber]OWK35335.1 putative O-linked N-acetylglucosamine transferase, SPINDLY family [Fimbriiglobus ruber]